MVVELVSGCVEGRAIIHHEQQVVRKNDGGAGVNFNIIKRLTRPIYLDNGEATSDEEYDLLADKVVLADFLLRTSCTLRREIVTNGPLEFSVARFSNDTTALAQSAWQ